MSKLNQNSNGWKGGLAVAALIVSLVATLAAIVGIPTCADVQTISKASAQHVEIVTEGKEALEKHMSVSDKKFETTVDLIKEQQELNKETFKEIKASLTELNKEQKKILWEMRK